MAKEYILKDRYGKDHTYNDEKIYVRGTDGELMPFTQGTVEPLEITENGTYTAPDGVSYNPVNVNVEPVLQDKTVTENGEYTADAGYDGLGKVLVEVANSGGGVKQYYKYVTATNTTNLTIEHGLGVTPDLVIFHKGTVSSASKAVMVIATRKEVADAGLGFTRNDLYYLDSSKNFRTYSNNGGDMETSTGAFVYNANERTISIRTKGTVTFDTDLGYNLYCFTGFL